MKPKSTRSLVSVIMPAFNAERYIHASIGSVLQQSYASWELIVIDDSSSDRTADIVSTLAAQEPRIRLLKPAEKLRASGARNLGLQSARGKYAAFLDADDLWMPEKLEVQIQHAEASHSPFIASSYQIISTEGQRIRYQEIGEDISLSDVLTKRAVIGCLTVFIEVEKFKGMQFRRDLKSAEDYEMWCRMIARCKTLNLQPLGIPRALASYRVHSGGKSSKKLKRIPLHWHIYRHCLNMSRVEAARSCMGYVINGVADRMPMFNGTPSKDMAP